MNDLHGPRARQALKFSSAELASITTAAFDGYVVPLAFTTESFEAKFRREDIDGAASRVLMDDGRPVAIVEPAGSGDIVIRTLVVARQARGRGRGLSMVDALASRHEGQDLIVPPTMPADLVPRFMSRAGFEPTTLAQFEMELDLTSQAGKPG